MNNPKTRTSIGRLRITWVLLGLAGTLAAGSYGWHVYSLFRDWQSNVPQPQLEKLTTDLRLFHKQAGHLPSTFHEINGRIWHTRPTPDYGDDGRQARTKNYYYFYTKVNEQACAIWALPMGPQRQYAASFFVVLTPEWLRSWKGKAFDDAAISRLPKIPTPEQLASLLMHEMPSRIFNQWMEKGVAR